MDEKLSFICDMMRGCKLTRIKLILDNLNKSNHFKILLKINYVKNFTLIFAGINFCVSFNFAVGVLHENSAHIYFRGFCQNREI
jgi:hypothetical protein